MDLTYPSVDGMCLTDHGTAILGYSTTDCCRKVVLSWGWHYSYKDKVTITRLEVCRWAPNMEDILSYQTRCTTKCFISLNHRSLISLTTCRVLEMNLWVSFKIWFFRIFVFRDINKEIKHYLGFSWYSFAPSEITDYFKMGCNWQKMINIQV